MAEQLSLSNGLSADTNSPKKANIKPKKSKSKKRINSAEKKEETSISGDPESSLPGAKDASTAVKAKESLSKSEQSQNSLEDIHAEMPKKSKKRKHMIVDHEAQNSSSSKSKDENPLEEPPKKKHKNRTEFADPRVDSTLNSQSRKALEYAFLQMNRPSKWKFNKARQNWLIRNIWNPEAISDVCFPFVQKYLANVQGGSRDKLKESCKTYLKPEMATESVETNAQTEDVPSSALKSILKNTLVNAAPTPGPLIDVAPVPGVLIASKSNAPSETLAKSMLVDIRRQRAQSLLDALSSTISTSLET